MNVLDGDFSDMIGVLLPAEKMQDYIYGPFAKLRCKTVCENVYGIRFAVVFENQNWSAILKRHRVSDIVLCAGNFDVPDRFNVIDGETEYKARLPEFMRKLSKSEGADLRVTVVDRGVSKFCRELTASLFEMFANVGLVCENSEAAEELAEKLEAEKGVILDVKNGCEPIGNGVAVVLENFGVGFLGKCSAIDIHGQKNDGIINDFYVPLKIKPPFKMKYLEFCECIKVAGLKKV